VVRRDVRVTANQRLDIPFQLAMPWETPVTMVGDGRQSACRTAVPHSVDTMVITTDAVVPAWARSSAVPPPAWSAA
jgi:hypothetical protein